MWAYSKKLQYPVSIKNKDLSMAKYIITQFGGPNGELGASLRYLTQRYANWAIWKWFHQWCIS